MPKKKTAKKTATRKPRADAQTADLLGTDDYSAVKRVAIDELVPDPNNARKHSPENLRAIAESLKDLGQYRPAIVNARNNQVVVGNGMLEAARSIGWQSLEVRFVELTDEQQRKLSIVDNRTAEVGVAWDEELLAAQLADLHGDNPDLADALLLDELLKVVDGATEHVEFEAGQGENGFNGASAFQPRKAAESWTCPPGSRAQGSPRPSFFLASDLRRDPGPGGAVDGLLELPKRLGRSADGYVVSQTLAPLIAPVVAEQLAPIGNHV